MYLAYLLQLANLYKNHSCVNCTAVLYLLLASGAMSAENRDCEYNDGYKMRNVKLWTCEMDSV